MLNILSENFEIKEDINNNIIEILYRCLIFMKAC